MKIEITMTEFRRVTKIAELFINRKVTIPILAMAKITAKDGRIVLSATTLDGWIDVDVTGTCHTDGEALLPLRALTRLAADLPRKENIVISRVSDIAISLKMDGAEIPIEIELDTLPVKDYPHRPEAIEAEAAMVFPGEELLRIFKLVRFAISKDPYRYYINGLNWRIKDEHLLTIATDGHRLALHKTPTTPEMQMPVYQEILRQEGGGITIPRDIVDILVKVLPDDNSRVSVLISAWWISFEWEGISIIAKLIDGTFPDHERVFPTYLDAHSVEISRAQLLRFATLSARLRLPKNDPAAVKMSIDGTSVDLKSSDSSLGLIHSRMACSYKGEPFFTGFNARYMSEILRTIRAENVTMLAPKKDAAGFSNGPVQITQADDPNYVILLMPMRV